MIEKRILLVLHAVLTVSSPNCCVASIREEAEVPQSTMRPRGHRVVVLYSIDQTAGGLVNQLLCHVGSLSVCSAVTS